MGNCISQAANKLSASKELPTSFPSPNETAASSKQSQGITEQQPQQLIKAVKAAEPDRQESGTQPSTPAALAAARADKATADRASTKKPRSPIKSQPTRFFQLLAEPDERIQHDQIRSASYDILLMESPAGSAHLKDAPDGGHAFHITRLAGRIASRQDSTKDMDAELLKLLVGDIYIHPEWLTLKHKIGEGAFALVEKHTLRRPVGDAKAKAVVAVKKLKPAVIASQSELKEFVQEANVLRKLQHRNIVDFQGIGAADTSSPQAMRLSMFLVQEFVGGGTLKQLIVRQNRSASQRPIYSRQDALRWATQLAEAFQYLHTHRPMIIHRDLKLDNVLLTNRRPGKADAKLADFGLHRMIKDLSTRVPMPDVIAAKPDPSVDRSAASCAAAGPSSSRSSDAAKSTVAVAPADRPASMSAGSSASTPSGAVQNPLDGKLHPGRTDPMANAASSSGRGDAQAKAEVTWAYKMTGQTGSLMYMAPEVLLTTIYNEKVDVFSFAVILFELLSYRTSLSMLPQPVSMDQAYRYAHKVANGYRRPLPAYWPEELRVLIADCWAAHPSQRPSFADVAARLADMKAKGITETWDAQERAGRPGCVVQ
ncbi:hypothetical protein WJX72_006439 [[Myrmecia] bisecta]|uniref:Protein kinase domain-containing protein n=1 Tax=[Myrmecia] bisecta TaxID=41462 RepID=A0AAW1PTX3_9CHLO